MNFSVHVVAKIFGIIPPLVVLCSPLVPDFLLSKIQTFHSSTLRSGFPSLFMGSPGLHVQFFSFALQFFSSLTTSVQAHFHLSTSRIAYSSNLLQLYMYVVVLHDRHIATLEQFYLSLVSAVTIKFKFFVLRRFLLQTIWIFFFYRFIHAGNMFANDPSLRNLS